MLCLGQPMPATLSTAHNNLNPIPTCIPWSAPRGATQCPHTISTIRPKHNASAGQMQGQNWTHTCLLGSTWVLCPLMPNSSAPHQTRQGPVHPQQVPEPATPPNLKSWNAAKARLPLLAQHHTSHHTKCNNVTNLNIFAFRSAGCFGHRQHSRTSTCKRRMHCTQMFSSHRSHQRSRFLLTNTNKQCPGGCPMPVPPQKHNLPAPVSLHH